MGKWMYSSMFFFTSTLVGGQWSASCPSRFTPGRRAPGTHWNSGTVDSRIGLDDVERREILRCQEWNPGSPVRSPLLHRLSYSESKLTCNTQKRGGTSKNYKFNVIIFFPHSKNQFLWNMLCVNVPASLWVLRDVTRLLIAPRLACGRTSRGPGRCFICNIYIYRPIYFDEVQ
jgi:hypothetical protein